MASATANRSVEELKADVEVTDQKFVQLLQRARGKPVNRTWTDTQGRTLVAAFIERADDAVVVLDEQKRTFRIPPERLSEADRQWVQEQTDATDSSQTPTAAWCLRALGAAHNKHYRLHESYPPAALVDDDAKPLLSWRVLLLQQLGYHSLAAAFRYDEPWDSEHNRKLTPLMPAVFRGGSEVTSTDRTSFVAIVTQAGTISDRYATRFDDIKDAKKQTLLLVESSESTAPVWTQPTDFTTGTVGNLKEMLRVRDSRVFVCFADASVGTLPVDTPEFEWKKLANIRDGMKIEAEIDFLPNLSSP
jgi:hypothetical protein